MSVGTHSASLCKHGNPHRITAMDTAPTYTLHQAPDPATRTASKQIFRLIQAVHHKQVTDYAITSNTFPPGMMRQVNRLTDFIKPATPSDTTRHKVKNNTDNWMRANMVILQEHYTNTIHTLGHTPHNPIALQIASGWARKRYGQRLRPDTITTTEGILNRHRQHNNSNNNNKPFIKTKTRLEGSLSTIPELLDEVEFPPLPVSSVADPRIGTMEQRGAPVTTTGGSPNMMSGQLKANNAIETTSETSLPLLLGSPSPTGAIRGSSTPPLPDDSPAGPSSTSSPFSLPLHISTPAFHQGAPSCRIAVAKAMEWQSI
ncbi:uncharacterized protein LOC133955837 [Platichthys flesus]|uniref:uncharacterized protein LOC133955837 n=1 Tax=Platichthys flesus TaxID=8260 RepID=UPI002DB87832|nr:uncharacterized protein LOC133955837 [Platichthys flesus]